MAKGTSSIQGNIQNLMRQLIREELYSLFASNAENTSGNQSEGFTRVTPGKAFVGRRKRRSRRSTAKARGRVVRPDDKRLKVNRKA